MKVINLFGGPGCRKSTIASDLFAKLKFECINCELVNEYAKGKVWEGSLATLDDQLYVFAKQYHRQFILDGQVDYAITDSPLLLSLYYGKNKSKLFELLVMERFMEFQNECIFLERVNPFQQNGRIQNEFQSKKIDEQILYILEKYHIPHHVIKADQHAANKIRKVLNV